MDKLTYNDIKTSYKNRKYNKYIDKKFKNKHRNRTGYMSYHVYTTHNDPGYNSFENLANIKLINNKCRSRKKQYINGLISKCVNDNKIKRKYNSNKNNNDCLVISVDIKTVIKKKLFFNRLLKNKGNNICKKKYPVLYNFGKILNSKLFDIINETKNILQWAIFINDKYNGKLSKNKCIKNYVKKDDNEWYFKKDIICYVNEKNNDNSSNNELDVNPDDKIVKGSTIYDDNISVSCSSDDDSKDDSKDDQKSIQKDIEPEKVVDKSIKIDDVFKHCMKFNWISNKEINKLWNNYRESWKKLSKYIDNMEVIRGKRYNHEIPISNSLLLNDKSPLKLVFDNIIVLYNKFLKQLSTQINKTKTINFMDLKSHNFVDPNIIDDIIKSCIIKTTTEPICKIVVFDLKKIEKKLKKTLINGKYKLNIQYTYFNFMKQYNLIPYINKLNVKPYHLPNKILFDFDEKMGKDYDYRCKVLNFFNNFIQKIVNQKIKPNKENMKLYDFILNNMTNNDKEQYKYELRIFNNDNIKVKHIHNIWYQMTKRLDEQFSFDDDECILCYYSLSDEYTIELECCKQIKNNSISVNKGLVLHYSCLNDYIKSKSINKLKGSKISIRDCVCINCNKPMMNSNDKTIFNNINKMYDKLTQCIKNTVKELEPTKDDEKVNDKEIIIKGNRKYAFYVCYECGDPFYGGLNECNNIDLPDDNIENRLCKKCDKPRTKCKKHGNMMIKRKCRYCCSPATFLCGTYSYCEECHKFGSNSFYNDDNYDNHRIPIFKGNRKKMNIGKISNNKHKCPLGIKHPKHGVEFIIGCSLCDTEYISKITANWMNYVGVTYCA